MGERFSFDKHVSSLDDLLEMSALYFSKVKFESKLSPEICQHLKVSPFFSRYRFGASAKTSQNLNLSSQHP